MVRERGPSIALPKETHARLRRLKELSGIPIATLVDRRLEGTEWVKELLKDTESRLDAK